MITKEQYIESLEKEFSIIKHLAEKIKPEQLGHKPTEAQRTLLELMHYLTYIFIAAVDGIASGDGNAYKKYMESEKPTQENFIEMMDKELKEIEKHLSPLSESDLDGTISMWGQTQSRSLHLLRLLQMASAYKMQMFL